jgi:N-acetylmuramoyl-L-alanine amidase
LKFWLRKREATAVPSASSRITRGRVLPAIGRTHPHLWNSSCASILSPRTLAIVSIAAFVLLASIVSHARVHRSQAWAETQFTKAEGQRETLKGRAEQARTRREYQAVIASYRRIVLEAPNSSKAEGSAFLVAELTAEMGRHFKDDMALYAAVREYKFLRREYPGSKHRIEALLAIGEIYKNDLGDESEARAALQDLIRRYPHSDLVKEAKAELQADTPEINKNHTDSASGKKEEADVDVEAPPASNNGHAIATTQATTTASSDKPIRVKDVQYWSTPEYTRIAIELEQDVEFVSQRIDNPDRIFFDLKNAKLASHLSGQSFDVDDGVVKKVRVAQYKPGRARVVIDTEHHASYNASLVLNPPRLVIDIHGDDNPAPSSASVEVPRVETRAVKATIAEGGSSDVVKRTAPQSSASAGPSGKPAMGHEASDVPALASVPLIGPKRVIVEADDDSDTSTQVDHDDDAKAVIENAKSNTSISGRTRNRKTRLASSRSMREADPTSDGDRSLIRTLGLRIGKIVIDPGHGGHDTGTIGPNGLLEKDLVLDVSKRLAKLLESRLGAEVVFTRRDDTFIPLETRTSIANQEQADLFVSVHANSSHDRDARGVETYYLNFTSSPEALEVAARENAASDKSIHELQDLVKKIALKEKIEESREFASDVQESLHSGLATKSPGVRDRGVKKAPFVVLIGANMPSILAEISFLSNPGDEKRLKTPDYRQRIAESLYRGVSRYVNGLGGVKVASKVEKDSAN